MLGVVILLAQTYHRIGLAPAYCLSSSLRRRWTKLGRPNTWTVKIWMF